MSKLIGPVKFIGTLDGLTVRKTEDGLILQVKSGPTAEAVRTKPQFDQTRRNAGEFKIAIRDAQLLRRSMGWLITPITDPKLNSRTNKLFHDLRKLDTIHEYGYRHAHGEALHLLEGVDLSRSLKLETALPVQLECAMDVSSGVVQVVVPSSIVRKKKTIFPKEATHFRIVSCAAMVDFGASCSRHHITESELLPLSKKMPAVTLESRVALQPGQTLLHAVGMVFYAVADGRAKLLKGGALKIVGVGNKEEVMEMAEATDHSEVADLLKPLEALVAEEILNDIECKEPGGESQPGGASRSLRAIIKAGSYCEASVCESTGSLWMTMKKGRSYMQAEMLQV